MIDKRLKVLFVDKNQAFLNEVLIMLQDMQNEWEIKFAYSANEALEITEKMPVNVIISDIDLPEMDGVKLISKIKKLNYEATSILMSKNEYLEPDPLKIIDYYLEKPFNLDKLKKIIINPVDFLDENKIRLLVLKMDKMPTIPVLYLELQKIMQLEEFSFIDIAKIIEKDLAMTSKILQFINSAYFSLRHRIYDVHHAVTYLGVETLKYIILALNIFCEFTDEEMEKFSINNLYNHSINISLLVSYIILTTITEESLAEESTISGILHDIGKLIFIKNKPEIYKEIYHIHNEQKIPLYVLEKKYFGVNHAELGGFLVKVWGFSDNLVNAVKNHHNQYNAFKSQMNIESAVYIANVLEHDYNSDLITDEQGKIQNYLREINQIENLSLWCTLAKKIKEKNNKNIKREDLQKEDRAITFYD